VTATETVLGLGVRIFVMTRAVFLLSKWDMSIIRSLRVSLSVGMERMGNSLVSLFLGELVSISVDNDTAVEDDQKVNDENDNTSCATSVEATLTSASDFGWREVACGDGKASSRQGVRDGILSLCSFVDTLLNDLVTETSIEDGDDESNQV